MSDQSLMLFSGNANKQLAQEIANYLKVPLGQAIIGKFSNGEAQVEILEGVRGRDVFVIQPTGQPTNDNVMELLMMIDAFKRASAARITAVIEAERARPRNAVVKRRSDVATSARKAVILAPTPEVLVAAASGYRD